MNELFQLALSPVNIVYTFLLVLVVFNWLLVFFGALDFGSLDIDLDLDVDVDVDADVSVGSNMAGGLAGVLHFLNFGRIPFMVIISFVILISWVISILANYYIGGGSIFFALVLIIPNLFFGLLLTKVITTPLVPVFENMEAGIQPVDYVGMLCKLVLPTTNTKMGQAEVLINGSPLRVNVKLENENTSSLQKGEEVIILRKHENKAYYIIKKYDESELF